MRGKKVSAPESGNDTAMRAAWPASTHVAPVPVPDSVDRPPAPGTDDSDLPSGASSETSRPVRGIR